jgi:hypothetical protein
VSDFYEMLKPSASNEHGWAIEGPGPWLGVERLQETGGRVGGALREEPGIGGVGTTIGQLF